MVLRLYARIVGVLLILLGLAGFAGFVDTVVSTNFYHACVGAFFAYLGFWQRDTSVVRRVAGGLGLMLLLSPPYPPSTRYPAAVMRSSVRPLPGLTHNVMGSGAFLVARHNPRKRSLVIHPKLPTTFSVPRRTHFRGTRVRA